ncbi:MAG: 5-formyltetrahydrofolate cyclo-ligase [Propylenella sp.]
MLQSVVTKAELRALGLARRAGMTERDRRATSPKAVARLRPLIRPGETVSLFWPMRDEIDPRGLIQDVLAAGGRIALPVIEKRRMFFRRFTGEACLEAGVFGTRHPNAAEPVIDPDLVVAPLAAFDRCGGRIGYGAGYYDQAITDLKARGRPLRIAGIAFACQEVEHVPVLEHDARLQAIATERELIETGAA